jgi:hypothetical protein
MQDTQTSVDLLGKRFGLKEVSFAFPGGRRYSGHSGEELMAAVKKASVTCALTTDGAPVDWRRDPFGWGRFNVYQWDTAATLRAKLNGCYGWAPKLQERLSLTPYTPIGLRELPGLNTGEPYCCNADYCRRWPLWCWPGGVW